MSEIISHVNENPQSSKNELDCNCLTIDTLYEESGLKAINTLVTLHLQSFKTFR